jgi:predicted TIM-barrel fold metal-dependent hydrolase
MIIDAHSHLWDKLSGCVDGQEVKSIGGGKSTFMGEVRQMMPPYMVDGRNTAEMFISNMDYAGVSAAVITQEYLDGDQNDYLLKAKQKYPDRFKICGLIDVIRPDYSEKISEILNSGFDAVKIPAQRLISIPDRVFLNDSKKMQIFKLMELHGLFLSIDLADGDEQTGELEEAIQECPNLKIAIGHFGMVTRPKWEQQIKLARYKNVMIESGGITWLFHKEFYPYHGAVNAIKEAAEIAGMGKLMWGSDYPRTMTAITYGMSYDFIEKSNKLKDEEKALFLGVNALKFYNFDNLNIPGRIKNMLVD